MKSGLLTSLTNRGEPVIEVFDANHRNRGELYLVHRWDGVDLRVDYAEETLRNLSRIWKRPVRLETRLEEKAVLLSFDEDGINAEEIKATVEP